MPMLLLAPGQARSSSGNRLIAEGLAEIGLVCEIRRMSRRTPPDSPFLFDTIEGPDFSFELAGAARWALACCGNR